MTSVPFVRGVIPTLAIALIILATLLLEARTASAAPAEDLTAKVVCEDDALIVTFAWTASRTGEQWLDISREDNGFAFGTFTGVGPLTSTRASYSWDGAAAVTAYFARLNTFDGDRWAPTPTLRFTTPACGAPPPSPAMEALRAGIEAQIDAWSFQTAVAVTDLQTGETIHVNGDRKQFAGCVMNFFALMQAVIDVQEGRYEEARVGDLISATVYGSNPITARDVLLISGSGDILAAMEHVNGLIDSLGLTDTFYDHPPAYWPASSLRSVDNLTTAVDMNRALQAVWQGEELSPEWRDYFFAKLTEVKPGLNYLIPAGVTDGVTGHKNGFFWLPEGWIDNDTGIVTFERGGQTYAYALTFLAQAVPAKYADIPLGQAISSLVWQHFNSTYP